MSSWFDRSHLAVTPGEPCATLSASGLSAKPPVLPPLAPFPASWQPPCAPHGSSVQHHAYFFGSVATTDSVFAQHSPHCSFTPGRVRSTSAPGSMESYQYHRYFVDASKGPMKHEAGSHSWDEDLSARDALPFAPTGPIVPPRDDIGEVQVSSCGDSIVVPSASARPRSRRTSLPLPILPPAFPNASAPFAQSPTIDGRIDAGPQACIDHSFMSAAQLSSNTSPVLLGEIHDANTVSSLSSTTNESLRRTTAWRPPKESEAEKALGSGSRPTKQEVADVMSALRCPERLLAAMRECAFRFSAVRVYVTGFSTLLELLFVFTENLSEGDFVPPWILA